MLQTIQKEVSKAQEKLMDAQQKVKREEEEKRALIEKYEMMCKDIISKHDYESELGKAKEELKRLMADPTRHESYV